MLKEKLRLYMKEYLEMNNLPTDKPFCCLNPAHADNHPSMSYDPKLDKVHCFSCGATYDIYDLIGLEYHLDNFNDKYRKACEIFGISVSGDDIYKYRDFSSIPFFKGRFFLKGDEEYGDNQMDMYERAYKNVKMSAGYLKTRGIDPALADRYGIGYYYGYKMQGVSCNVVLFPIDTTHYIVRNEKADVESPYRFYKHGGSPFPVWNLDAVVEAYKTGHPLYVTEGIIDALSIITAGGIAVALNGTASIKLLLSAIQDVCTEEGKKLTVIAACDNDSAGEEANRAVMNAVSSIGHTCYKIDLYGKCKDANEALCTNRNEFVSQIKSLQTKQGLSNLAFELEESDGAFMMGYMNTLQNYANMPFIATGFPSLDKIMYGGLRPGLYVLGSQPSIGKTTLWVQLRDRFCLRNQHVLFFSLEMGKIDLQAKTISRLMYEHCIQHGLPVDMAKDAVSVGTWRLIESFSDEDRKLFEDTVKECQQISMKSKTYVESDSMDVETVLEIVDKYVQRTGIRPVVMIDYLQILNSKEPNLIERERLGIISKKLRNMSLKWNIPVLVLSSINRPNYNCAISYESFFGSNGIEYYADVLLGLQYRDMSKYGFDLKAAEDEDVRKLDLVIIKNRYGQKNIVLPLDYIPKYNHFAEPIEESSEDICSDEDDEAEDEIDSGLSIIF